MPYTLKPYDVLQVERDGTWLDFSTLRTESDASHAVSLVAGRKWEGEALPFRIVRNVSGKGQAVVWPEPVTLLAALETLVDQSALAEVLGNLSEVCGLKAQHLRENWQDDDTAKGWDKLRAQLEKLANRAAIDGL